MLNYLIFIIFILSSSFCFSGEYVFRYCHYDPAYDFRLKDSSKLYIENGHYYFERFYYVQTGGLGQDERRNSILEINKSSFEHLINWQKKVPIYFSQEDHCLNYKCSEPIEWDYFGVIETAGLCDLKIRKE